MEYPIPEDLKDIYEDAKSFKHTAAISNREAVRLIERIARLEHERKNPEQHSEHWRNPETGYIECECCQKWAMDMIEVKKQLAEANAEIIRLNQQIEALSCSKK